MLGGEEGVECKVCVDGIRLEYVSKFKYLACVSDESGTDDAECQRKVASGRRVAYAIRSLVNAGVLQLECAKVLHEPLFMFVLMHGSETMIWKEKERSRIRAVQIDNLRGLLGIRRLGKVPNTQIRELCEVSKGVDERINEGVLQWFAHMERMENDRIAKRVYVGECAAGKPRKRGFDTVKECFNEKRFGCQAGKENGA